MTTPGLNSISPVFMLHMVKPVMSEGIISGVNWMRPKEQSSDLAKDAAKVVLPTPGTSSMRTCPLHSRAIRASSIASSLPTMTRRILLSSLYTRLRGSSLIITSFLPRKQQRRSHYNCSHFHLQ